MADTKLVHLFWIWTCCISVFSDFHGAYAIDASIMLAYNDANGVQINKLRGRYGNMSPTGDLVQARLYHYVTEDGANHGCTPLHNETLATIVMPWIALVRRGSCRFQTKLEYAIGHNASALIVYDYGSAELLTMELHSVDIVSIFMKAVDGEYLAALADNGTSVIITIKDYDVSCKAQFNFSVPDAKSPKEEEPKTTTTTTTLKTTTRRTTTRIPTSNTSALTSTTPTTTLPKTTKHDNGTRTSGDSLNRKASPEADHRLLIAAVTGWLMFALLLIGVVAYAIWRGVTSERRTMGGVAYTVRNKDLLLTESRTSSTPGEI